MSQARVRWSRRSPCGKIQRELTKRGHLQRVLSYVCGPAVNVFRSQICGIRSVDPEQREFLSAFPSLSLSLSLVSNDSITHISAGVNSTLKYGMCARPAVPLCFARCVRGRSRTLLYGFDQVEPSSESFPTLSPFAFSDLRNRATQNDISPQVEIDNRYRSPENPLLVPDKRGQDHEPNFTALHPSPLSDSDKSS